MQRDAMDEEPQPTFVTIDEAAALLRVNKKTLYDAAARGELAGATRIGRTVRIHWPTLLASLPRGEGPQGGA